ncbi:MAG: DUF4943 family protein [Cyclobacteriaceae bacterium]|nr:DUF4943 family protein [Cyclobacteriaceae bacterium]
MKVTVQRSMAIVRKSALLVFTVLLCVGCSEDDFDPSRPNVGAFVEQLKRGTYSNYEKGDEGQDLWLKMPEFNEDHIAELIEYARDTTHIKVFPSNPLASMPPFPPNRDYLYLGEYLLWCVEGVRNGSGYGSLVPYLRPANLPPSGISSATDTDVLAAREKYLIWWKEYKDGDWKGHHPLESTDYTW